MCFMQINDYHIGLSIYVINSFYQPVFKFQFMQMWIWICETEEQIFTHDETDFLDIRNFATTGKAHVYCLIKPQDAILYEASGPAPHCYARWHTSWNGTIMSVMTSTCFSCLNKSNGNKRLGKSLNARNTPAWNIPQVNRLINDR